MMQLFIGNNSLFSSRDFEMIISIIASMDNLNLDTKLYRGKKLNDGKI